uniref:Uncharacterized protein n=1 Tax=Glossina pallidipes TaxID=7398 RepID=A0A1A9ZZV6_GLOPL
MKYTWNKANRKDIARLCPVEVSPIMPRDIPAIVMVLENDAKIGGLSDQLVSKAIKNRLATSIMSDIGVDEMTTAFIPSSFLCPAGILVITGKPNRLTTTLDCMEAICLMK